jgi:hypothetical protein
MVMHHHLTNPWGVASFSCSASDHGMQTRFGGRLSRVEGGLKAALHDAATPHHTTPPAMSIKLPSRSRTYRQAVPSCTAARQHIESLPTCRLPYGVFVQRCHDFIRHHSRSRTGMAMKKPATDALTSILRRPDVCIITTFSDRRKNTSGTCCRPFKTPRRPQRTETSQDQGHIRSSCHCCEWMALNLANRLRSHSRFQEI